MTHQTLTQRRRYMVQSINRYKGESFNQCDQKKIAKCLKKLPKNDFPIKMTDFENFTKMHKNVGDWAV